VCFQVEKKDLFFGPYRPDLNYTDGVRILAYLDPTEEAHTKAKKYCRALLATYSKNSLKAITERTPELFANWEGQVGVPGLLDFSYCPTVSIFTYLFNFAVL
jgi:hypothetical protein